ncbi:MAG: murein biosynthesis integral membrane protein MurJ [Planctomycetaceae bacterium]|nr:murein biosynthesis integral membrane protein MurJ [Planctomycetaceae bacterium]
MRIVSACTLLSRVLGLGRDMALAALFGGGPILDAFIVAFRLPNLARQLFGEGALTTAFLPVFVRDLERLGSDSARQTLSAVTWTVGSVLLSLVLIAEGVLWGLLALTDVSPELRPVLELLALLFPYMVFICLAALFSAALHSLRQFLWPGLVPVVLNVVWLVGTGLAWWLLEEDLPRARLIAVSVVGAGLLQLLLPMYVLRRQGWAIQRHCPEGWSRVREVFRAILPVVAGIGLTQIGAVIDSIIAWGLAANDSGDAAICQLFGVAPVLEPGTASALYLGQRLYQFPLGVFGVALGTVLFPVLTRHAERGDLASLRVDLTRGLQLVAAIAVPASAGLLLLASPVTELLFRHGRFDAADARLATAMVATYGSGVWVYIGLQIINRAFYAVGDRRTPMKLGLLALIINLVLNLTLIWMLGGVGLALAGVLSAGTQLLLSLRRLEARVGTLQWSDVGRTAAKVLIVTAAMSVSMLIITAWLTDDPSLIGRLIRLAVPLLIGGTVFLAGCKLLRIREVGMLFRPEAVTDPEPTEVTGND